MLLYIRTAKRERSGKLALRIYHAITWDMLRIRIPVQCISDCTRHLLIPGKLCDLSVCCYLSTRNLPCFKKVLLLLAIIGGINWGIYGIWGFNAVGWLLGGSMSWLSRTVFIVVGAAALCLIPGLFAPDPKAAE